jgi:hypothetical protein
MGTPINVTPTFSIGEKVWLKTMLDVYLDTTLATGMKALVMFDINKLLYRVSNISVVVTTTTKIYYTLTLVATQPNLPTAITAVNEVPNIVQENVYSLAQGKTLINTKITDFTNYLNALT